MTSVHKSICRICANNCSVEVDIDEGRIARIRGDIDSPVYRGYRCQKGSEQRNEYSDPSRLLHPLKQTADGTFVRIPIADAVAEIADRLSRIIAEFGPRAVALYYGSYFIYNVQNIPFAGAFMNAIGSPMIFNAVTIDQPGKQIAKALHGLWLAPDQSLLEPKVALMVGTNPVVSHQGRIGAPAQLFRDFERWGTDLIVIDPRRTELADRATLHLQPHPGQDAVILAGMLKVILDDSLGDADFCRDNVDGVDALRQALSPYTMDFVAARSGLDPVDVTRAARMFAAAGRGYCGAGTGSNMSAQGTLIEYLLLCLNSVCGYWSRARDPVRNRVTLISTDVQPTIAQAMAPFPGYGFGERMRVRGLTQSIAGLPVAALPEEILTAGEGQIRTLLSLGGNPVATLPDQLRVTEALRSLSLLVHTDVQMSPTAHLADYVIPSKLLFEVPGTSMIADFTTMFAYGFGYRESFAQYTPALVDPPEGAELLEHWELLYLLARELKLGLELVPGFDVSGGGAAGLPLDMSTQPSTDEILEIVHAGSRIPLSEVKGYDGGALFPPEEPVVVAEKDEGWPARLNVADSAMMADLTLLSMQEARTGRRFRLISRRARHVFNAPSLGYPDHAAPFNPVFVHPDDMVNLRIDSGDLVEIESDRAAIHALVSADTSMRPGSISMTHGFGAAHGTAVEPTAHGSNTGVLIDATTVFDRYSGQPRMSAIPVDIRRIGPVEARDQATDQ